MAMQYANGIASGGADRFAEVLPVTLQFEGGWSNNPKDPGGPTMRGVIQRVYNGYRDGRGLPRQSVRLISDGELLDIYRAGYWNAVRGDELPWGVDLAVFDLGVNSGPVVGIQALQRAIGVNVDGHMGPATLAAARRADPVATVKSIMDWRRAYLRSLPIFRHFGVGWMRRCDGIESACLAACGYENGVDVHAMVLSDPDAQSDTQARATPVAPKPPVATEATLAASGTVSLVSSGPAIIAKASEGGVFTWRTLLLALLSDPLFWAGIMSLWGAIGVFIYRRRHQS